MTESRCRRVDQIAICTGNKDQKRVYFVYATPDAVSQYVRYSGSSKYINIAKMKQVDENGNTGHMMFIHNNHIAFVTEDGRYD